jgi:hypothetical protein
MYWMRVSGSIHSRNPTVSSTASTVTPSHDWHMEVACLRERSVAKSVSDPFAALNDHKGRSEKRHQLFASRGFSNDFGLRQCQCPARFHHASSGFNTVALRWGH